MIKLALKDAQKMAGIVQKTLPQNSPKPLLNGVMVHAENGMVRFSTYNGVSGFQVESLRVDSDEIQEDFIVLSGERFLNFIKAVKGETLEMTRELDAIHMKVGKTKSQLPASDTQDYPRFPVMDQPIVFPGFLRGVAKTHPFAKHVPEKPDDGVHVVVKSQHFAIESTSGREVARVQGDVDYPDSDWVLAADNAKDLGAIFSLETNVLVEQQDAFLLVSDGASITWVTRLVDRTFRDMDSVLAFESAGHWTASRTDLLDSTKCVLAVIGDKSNRSAKIQFAHDFLTMIGQSPYGAVEEKIAAEFSGKELDAGFDLACVQRILAQWDFETVQADLFVRGKGVGLMVHNESEQYMLAGVMKV